MKMSCREFTVLFTIHKTQKSKKWHDGVLRTSSSGNKIKPGKEFESDRYLISVEEEKISLEKDTNCISQEATKIITTNVILSNSTRCHLPVGLKRKYTGFQGPREILKKLTVEQNDVPCIITKIQQPSSLPPQLYTASPLFSTICTKETSSCSLLQEESPETKKGDSTSITTLNSNLPASLAQSHNCKLRDSEKMNIFYSTGAEFTSMASSPEGYSHGNGTHENRRSKSQILALLDRKTESSCNILETPELNSQKPFTSPSITCSVNVSDHHAGYSLDGKAEPRLGQNHDVEWLTDCNLTGNLSEGLGRECSLNIQEIQQKCEKEDSIDPSTSELTKPKEICTTVSETLGDDVCKAKKCFINFGNTSMELLSTTDSDQSEQAVVQVEMGTKNTNAFVDINFDLLGELISEKNGTTTTCENEMLLQRSLNTHCTFSKSIPALSIHSSMEVHQGDNIELETHIPVAEVMDLEPSFHGKNLSGIKSRTLPNIASVKHSSDAWKNSIKESKDPGSKVDDCFCNHSSKDTISLLKSLSEHSTAIESLETLNAQKHFEDTSINGNLEQPFEWSEGIIGEHSLRAPKNSSPEFSCLPETAKYIGMFEKPAVDNWIERITSDRPHRTPQLAEFKGYQMKGSPTSDTVIRVPQDELEFKRDFDPWQEVPRSLTAEASFELSRSSKNALFQFTDSLMDGASFHKERNFNVEKEDTHAWYRDDQVPEDPDLSSNIPDHLVTSGVHSDFKLMQRNLHKMQQVPSVEGCMGSVLRHSKDSNVKELDYSMPNHQLSSSGCSFGNERADSLLKDEESRIQSVLRLRSPLVTLPATDKCINQALPSNFAKLSSVEPNPQWSTIYSVNSQREGLCESSEKRLWSQNCNISECTDAQIQEYSKPMDLNSALRPSKWLKYQISAPTNPTFLNHDVYSEEDPVYEKGFEKMLKMQENIKDSSSVQLIKDKLVKQHGNIFVVNETCSTPNISSTYKGYSALSKTNHVLSRKDSNSASLTELNFPRAERAQGTKTLKRQVIIPVTFLSPAHYKEVFTSVITEHFNVLLYELSQKLHKALSKVDMSEYSSEIACKPKKEQHSVPLCQHQQPAKLAMVKKEGPNKGRLFYTCDASKLDQCKFFKWLDHVLPIELNQKIEPQSKLELPDAKSLGAFVRSQHIPLYCGCQLHVRKTPAFQIKKNNHGKLKELINDGNLENCYKTKLYLWLSRKEHSSVYSKDDLWVISKTLKFDSVDTFIACSVFYGPSSNSEIELLPLKGYSPSNWSSDMIVHALFVGNVSTELTSLRNLQEHVNPAILPLMPYLLKMPGAKDEPIIKSARQQFVSPALKPAVMTGLLCKERTMLLAMEMIEKFNLNTDQRAAFRQVALMTTKEENSLHLILPITLIHGVYGTGKSYLLAIVILFLVRLFEESEATEGPRPVQWKLLISASTNVAVDRVLLGLLELGFDKFIRVGSIRKIAKPILPYSLHAGSDSEELRELQALIKDDLTPVEKMHVRRSIEQHKLGRNRAMLKEVRVVGATCAACPFRCLNNLSFPLVLLDECSQITEPMSLLPIARFGCEKLILVGDPKQLPPTIQGSESAHDAGLEQTLFDRMCLMGYQPVMLRTQYRCHPAISAITNELFYDGSLIDGPSTMNLNPLLNWLPTLCFYNVKGHEQVEIDGSYHNLEEASFTAKLIQSLIASGIKGHMIGVITLYKSQMYKLCGLLNYTAQCDLAEIKTVQVSTVDAFQGAEKEVIVLSCVRTRQVGFIDSEKRMNVALTRGKRHLLIIGSLTCLRSNRLWEKVIHHCERRENGLKHGRQCEPELENILKNYNDQMLTKKKPKKKTKVQK
ncbi:5'-3' DNA helicase ZGRF1-like isoform X2 [Narcine bancroftii]|uniref:5'-3' DNA helicase ZGRF1-like isoform X2 n=1 Tax=Narcine bancroftii TaxID=1343680 RepID=UPI0038313260